MDIDTAANSLKSDIQRDVNWFATPGEKNFVDPMTIGVIGFGLIKLYAAIAAKAAVVAAGAEAGKLAVDYIRDLMSGRSRIEQAALKDELAAARAELSALSPADADARLARARDTLTDQFATVMPRPRATKLAERVDAAAAPLLRGGS